MLIVYHENSVRFSSLFAKQNGRPDIAPVKRGTIMIGLADYYTMKIRLVSTGFRRAAKCRPYFLGGKVGTVMIALAIIIT